MTCATMGKILSQAAETLLLSFPIEKTFEKIPTWDTKGTANLFLSVYNFQTTCAAIVTFYPQPAEK